MDEQIKKILDQYYYEAWNGIAGDKNEEIAEKIIALFAEYNRKEKEERQQWIKDTREFEKKLRNRTVKELCNAETTTQMRYSLRALLDYVEHSLTKEEHV